MSEKKNLATGILELEYYPEQVEDKFKEFEDVKIRLGGSEVSLYTELTFAAELYEKAVEGFEDDPPPNPIVWLKNGKKLCEHWENQVDSLTNLFQDDPEKLEAFNKCSPTIYMKMMSTIYKLFYEDNEELKDSISEKLQEHLKNTVGKHVQF